MEYWPPLIVAALAASLMAAIVGTGGGILLLPVLASFFGVRDAVPIYAVAQLIGNIGRAGFNRAQISWRVVIWFAVGAIPLALLGSWLFTRIPDAGLPKILGGFLILSVIVRRLHPALSRGFRPCWFAPIGAVFSVVSAIVGSAGPFLAPFYLSYGLTKGAFIGTEAMGTAIMHVAKLFGYQSLGVMSRDIWLTGLTLGPAMLIGAYAGKKILDRVPVSVFLVLVDAAIVGFGLWFVFK